MASFERSSRGNASFRIDLTKTSPWYYGDVIRGQVTVNVRNIFYLRGLVLVLRGTESCSITGTSAATGAQMLYEKEVEILSTCVSLCGPPALATQDGNDVVRYENTSYSIPSNSPLLNITHGKHQFPFGMPTDGHKRGNLPATFSLVFPQSRDNCAISYVLELFCFTQGSCQLVAHCPVPIGSLQPYLPPSIQPGRLYEETIHYPDLGSIEIDVELDKDTYSRRSKVKLELNITNNLSVRIEGLQASVTNHVLVEGSYIDINPGMRGKVLRQEFSTRSGDETVVEFSDIMAIEPGANLKRIYKMEVPRQVWPTCIIGTANSHPFWIRCYIDICFDLKADVNMKSGRVSLGSPQSGEDDFRLVGDDERGLRIPLFIVDDRDEEENSKEYGDPIHPSGPFMNRGVVTWTTQDDKCFKCHNYFSILRWRHHCRACGNAVCNSCSAVLQVPLLFGDSAQRLCHNCNIGLED